MSVAQLNDDLYLAICRSLSNVELTGDSFVDNELLVGAACDSLHALARWFHTKHHAFGLLYRLADKRVLATTCDHEAMGNDIGAFDDAKALSVVVASLTSQRLQSRARTATDQFFSIISANADDTKRWFHERTLIFFGCFSVSVSSFVLLRRSVASRAAFLRRFSKLSERSVR
jgi:hypothetical protein